MLTLPHFDIADPTQDDLGVSNGMAAQQVGLQKDNIGCMVWVRIHTSYNPTRTACEDVCVLCSSSLDIMLPFTAASVKHQTCVAALHQHCIGQGQGPASQDQSEHIVHLCTLHGMSACMWRFCQHSAMITTHWTESKASLLSAPRQHQFANGYSQIQTGADNR